MEVTQDAHKTVTDYLSGLVWDGTPRLDRWLVDCAGAEDTPHVRAASRVMLVAAVRRSRDPGCRFDQMSVLDGPQGCGKSAALRLLAVEDRWFCDALPLGDGERRIIEATQGKWIVEAGELQSLLEHEVDDARDRESAPRRRPVALKVFLSRTHDETRLAYQREISRVPRGFVVVGTTCATDYLVDATGSRRFVPIRVQRFDLKRLRGVRDQLWAEAAVAEASGEPIYLSTVNAPS